MSWNGKKKINNKWKSLKDTEWIFFIAVKKPKKKLFFILLKQPDFFFIYFLFP